MGSSTPRFRRTGESNKQYNRNQKAGQYRTLRFHFYGNTRFSPPRNNHFLCSFELIPRHSSVLLSVNGLARRDAPESQDLPVLAA